MEMSTSTRLESWGLSGGMDRLPFCQYCSGLVSLDQSFILYDDFGCFMCMVYLSYLS